MQRNETGKGPKQRTSTNRRRALHHALPDTTERGGGAGRLAAPPSRASVGRHQAPFARRGAAAVERRGPSDHSWKPRVPRAFVGRAVAARSRGGSSAGHRRDGLVAAAALAAPAVAPAAVARRAPALAVGTVGRALLEQQRGGLPQVSARRACFGTRGVRPRGTRRQTQRQAVRVQSQTKGRANEKTVDDACSHGHAGAVKQTNKNRARKKKHNVQKESSTLASSPTNSAAIRPLSTKMGLKAHLMSESMCVPLPR